MTDTTVRTLPAPASLFRPSADNWKLAILAGVVVTVLATLTLPAKAAFWVVGAAAALIAAAFVVNAYRRRYYGGLLVAPAIAVLFVMNIFLRNITIIHISEGLATCKNPNRSAILM